MPTERLASGYLPDFNHDLRSGHWSVGYGYSGYSEYTQNPDNEDLEYLDTSEEHQNEYYLDYSIETFLSPSLSKSTPCYLAGVVG